MCSVESLGLTPSSIRRVSSFLQTREAASQRPGRWCNIPQTRIGPTPHTQTAASGWRHQHRHLSSEDVTAFRRVFSVLPPSSLWPPVLAALHVYCQRLHHPLLSQHTCVCVCEHTCVHTLHTCRPHPSTSVGIASVIMGVWSLTSSRCCEVAPINQGRKGVMGMTQGQQGPGSR